VPLAPKLVIMNRGSRLWIISEEISINKLTKPKAQTLLGICFQVGFGTITFKAMQIEDEVLASFSLLAELRESDQVANDRLW
jgi:hypothetical protein